MGKLLRPFAWTAVAALGMLAFAVLALHRGESVNAVWLLAAAACTYLIAYRFYSRFIATRVLQPDPLRLTPAMRRNDGLDYVPTQRWVLFGHHFAAIAGAGPLIGPVLAAQMGYLPGTLWILIGVVFAGAVQDFLILFFSVRRDGRTLGAMIREELGQTAGVVALIGMLAIMIILLAVLGRVVVKALANSPWGLFTVIATLPIALAMGVYLRWLRPGRVGEASLFGVAMLLASIVIGGRIAADPAWAAAFTVPAPTLTLWLIGYGFVAAVLPVWLLLAPRDYLSTFLKIGTILGLAVGILIVLPELRMPAVTRFVDGSGPVFAGSLFPFLFITIACGAVSGFHALIASGTTPKMLENESQARMIGYGAMLMESFVAIMAMITASVLDPAVYFAMNSPVALLGDSAASAAQAIRGWGFAVTPEILTNMAAAVGEPSLLSRAGGAPTLAVGMAQIISQIFGGAGMAFWYHFAILFEALFILTTIDAGTRVGRFMIQDMLGLISPSLRRTESWPANILATALCASGWGWFLYQGVIDPLGGINSLWPLFGIANQMLAGMALIAATVILFRMKRERYAWITIVPTSWLLVCTLTAGAEKLWHSDPRIGFLAHAHKFADALSHGELLAPAKTLAQMHRVILNDYVDAALCALLISVVLAMTGFGLAAIRRARASNNITSHETVPVYAERIDEGLAHAG